jgi:hypothetical protein
MESDTLRFSWGERLDIRTPTPNSIWSAEACPKGPKNGDTPGNKGPTKCQGAKTAVSGALWAAVLMGERAYMSVSVRSMLYWLIG